MNLTANDLGTLITLSAAAAGSIIVILVNCITNSRCSDISIAWGCFHCIREVPKRKPSRGAADSADSPTPASAHISTRQQLEERWTTWWWPA